MRIEFDFELELIITALWLRYDLMHVVAAFVDCLLRQRGLK